MQCVITTFWKSPTKCCYDALHNHFYISSCTIRFLCRNMVFLRKKYPRGAMQVGSSDKTFTRTEWNQLPTCMAFSQENHISAEKSNCTWRNIEMVMQCVITTFWKSPTKYEETSTHWINCIVVGAMILAIQEKWPEPLKYVSYTRNGRGFLDISVILCTFAIL